MTFQPGETVTVRHISFSVVNGVVVGQRAQEPFTGTVVSYWRNGEWIVREPRFGTTCAYPEAELSSRNEQT